MTEPRETPAEKPAHGHVGPTTAAEDLTRRADPEIVSPEDKARIAEAASREEDA